MYVVPLMTTDLGGQEVQELVIIYDKITSQNGRANFPGCTQKKKKEITVV